MKELVRAHGDEMRQLMLAHDFRIAATGNPHIIRSQLQRIISWGCPKNGIN
jgi:hypothetical protein